MEIYAITPHINHLCEKYRAVQRKMLRKISGLEVWRIISRITLLLQVEKAVPCKLMCRFSPRIPQDSWLELTWYLPVPHLTLTFWVSQALLNLGCAPIPIALSDKLDPHFSYLHSGQTQWARTPQGRRRWRSSSAGRSSPPRRPRPPHTSGSYSRRAHCSRSCCQSPLYSSCWQLQLLLLGLRQRMEQWDRPQTAAQAT